jgi:hypothetical protein
MASVNYIEYIGDKDVPTFLEEKQETDLVSLCMDFVDAGQRPVKRIGIRVGPVIVYSSNTSCNEEVILKIPATHELEYFVAIG